VDVAVVIPTRGRRETRLAFALEALARQTLERDRFEVVVVRDPDAPGPFATPPDGLDVRFLPSPEPGRAAANRNAGWLATSAPLIAFTDDDCRPEPRWLELLLAAKATAGDDAETFIQGRTEPDPDERDMHWGLAHSILIDAPSPWFETCNIAYPRALLERVGGFDEAFPGDWAEDTDLGLRAQDAGAQRIYAPAALVWHAVVSRRLPAAMRDARRGQNIPLVLARHPEQRRALHLGLFLRESHALLALALAGAMTRRPLVALAAGAPYVRLHLDAYARGARGRLGGLLGLPGHVVVDCAEAAAVLRGAIRHRTPIV